MAAVVAFLYARKRAEIKAGADEKEQHEKDLKDQMSMRSNSVDNLKEAAARAVIATKLGKIWRKRGQSPVSSRKKAPYRHAVQLLSDGKVNCVSCEFLLLNNSRFAVLSRGPFIRRKHLAQRFDLEETMMTGLVQLLM